MDNTFEDVNKCAFGDNFFVKVNVNVNEGLYFIRSWRQ